MQTILTLYYRLLTGQVTPKAFAAIGWRYYLVFCILSITNALTIWALFPETKGRREFRIDFHQQFRPGVQVYTMTRLSYV